MTNPLLNMQGHPPFSQIQPEHIVPAIEQVLNDNRTQIAHLIDTPYTWANFIQPLNELNDRLNRIWSPIGHLHGVADSEDLRTAYNACLPILSAYRSEFGQNKALYAAYQAIADSPDYAQLEAAQQQVITNELRDFHLAGIDLPCEKQARYKEIQQRLSQLGSQFSENVLDASHAWKKHITDESLLAGLPDTVRALAKQNAEQDNLEGWLFTLDFPCYQPVLSYADKRELRHEMYVAFMTRASDQGTEQWDNSAIMQEIMALRHELATLLGFANYAEYSLSTKMAKTPQHVLDFLSDLAQRSKPVAVKELTELQAFVKEHYGIETLEMWDIPYYSEKLRQHCYEISQEMLRPYFPLPKVLEGLFSIVQRLYGLAIQPHKGVDTWHCSDVQFFDIYDESGALRGQFYLDSFARKGKRGGAWMDECIIRHRTGSGLQIPVAYLVCNFTPPIGDKPSLLTHQEVTTLFHEFGHGLHHMLTQVDYAPVAGINGVAWDAVELPSQFMENWAWEREALDLFATHYETGAPLPDDLFEKMLAAKNFQAGLFMLRQLEFALFDFRLHSEDRADIQALLDEVRQQVAVLMPPDFVRFQHSFSHIFAGGYAAGYYSYKWAEVLSADAFSKFEENGIFDRATGLQFLQSILEKGGSKEPMELFVEFRGRVPEIEALLRHTGIAA
ncbi:oligopeptidase A [Candidatus Thiomargarita nelsonii]|uniref:oligopeptidase A n=1 Tax=Candidatus Thiomargarita nelsonii TaxID=1003181 RepID=A0A0A6PLU6_9GAMM|nr:oligopeptidase A [Candidatus Thiomargarita nelsonii]